MNALVIFSHPNPKSFNAAILGVVKEELARKGSEVRIKDLYAMNWNPVLSGSDFEGLAAGKPAEDIAREQADVAWADVLVLISPIWWFSVTAMLKGYIDRVMSQGFAYDYTEQGPRGLLQGKRALIITSSGADEKVATQSGMIEAIKTTFVRGIFGFCGFSKAAYLNCYAVPSVSEQERKGMLEDVRGFIDREI